MYATGTRFALPPLLLLVVGVCCAQQQEEGEQEGDVEQTGGGRQRGPNSTLALLVEKYSPIVIGCALFLVLVGWCYCKAKRTDKKLKKEEEEKKQQEREEEEENDGHIELGDKASNSAERRKGESVVAQALRTGTPRITRVRVFSDHSSYRSQTTTRSPTFDRLSFGLNQVQDGPDSRSDRRRVIPRVRSASRLPEYLSSPSEFQGTIRDDDTGDEADGDDESDDDFFRRMAKEEEETKNERLGSLSSISSASSVEGYFVRNFAVVTKAISTLVGGNADADEE